MRIRDKGAVTIPDSTTTNTAVLVKDEPEVAQFTVKPANGANGVTLEDVIISGSIDDEPLTENDIMLSVDGDDWDDDIVAVTS
jgi:hypothetical protein